MPDQGVSPVNSTHTPLAGGGVFTGVWEQLPYLTAVTVMAFSDVGSAANGLQLQWSNDPNVDPTIGTGIAEYTVSRSTTAVPGGFIARYESQRLAEWFRVIYVNGGAGQSQFDLETIYDTDGSSRVTADDAPLPVTLSGGLSNPLPVSVADGADVAQGSTTDLAVTTDSNGTLSAKLRGLVKILNNVWTPANARLRVETDQATSNIRITNPSGTPIGDTSNPVVEALWLNSGTNFMMRGLGGQPPNYVDGQATVTVFDMKNNGSFLVMAVAPMLIGSDSGGAIRTYSERTPTIFKTVQTQAVGNTALWTPNAGKKFRLMRYMVQVTDDATQAGPGVIAISLLDGALATAQVHSVFVPAVALNTNGQLYTSPWIDLGNGILSAAANNVLNLNLSAALVGGFIRVIACGTEE